MANKREVVTLSVSQADMQRLEEIANENNCKWGDKPNVSEMLRQIASGELAVISRKNQLAKSEQLTKSISKAYAALIEIQQILFGDK